MNFIDDLLSCILDIFLLLLLVMLVQKLDSLDEIKVVCFFFNVSFLRKRIEGGIEMLEESLYYSSYKI